MTPDGLARLRSAKLALQQRLQRVMSRTERLASTSERGGMLVDASSTGALLHSVDVRAFLGAQNVADAVEQGDVIEYWKSAPYLFNFMDNYALKQAFKEAPDQQQMLKLVRQFPETFLDLERARGIPSRRTRKSETTRVAFRDGGSRHVAAPLDTSIHWLLQSGRTVCCRGIGHCHKEAGVFRLAHGAASRRFTRIIRS